MIPRHNQAIDYLFEGMVQRKLHFDREEMSGYFLEQACQELEGKCQVKTGENINGLMVRYAVSTLDTLDEFYRASDTDTYFVKDKHGVYFISNIPEIEDSPEYEG